MPTRITAAVLRGRIARNVKRYRLAEGLTQKEAAARAGIDPRYWHKIEHGKANITFTTLVKLANGFDVDAATILEARRASRRGARSPALGSTFILSSSSPALGGTSGPRALSYVPEPGRRVEQQAPHVGERLSYAICPGAGTSR
jgi:DNA-binding XRE family transcriptional regulator